VLHDRGAKAAATRPGSRLLATVGGWTGAC
jgi:hypothetical protein